MARIPNVSRFRRWSYDLAGPRCKRYTVWKGDGSPSFTETCHKKSELRAKYGPRATIIRARND